ncbi:MAG: hypothetical protein KJ621_04920 [Proteobacteria bacterium]|nr:hypothetical protein [Pseudomonadota bacterium]MBU1742508.1 hypothetical protein [Pseudomonadota bacterium]
MKIGSPPPPNTPPVPPGGGNNGNGGPKNPVDLVRKPTATDKVTWSPAAKEFLEVYKKKISHDLEAVDKLIDKSVTAHTGKDVDLQVGDVKYVAKDPQILNKLFRWVSGFFKK